ncbi:MAG: OmpA family protein [Saprospiraceae bacterium]|nr:OmpA family protein [Saprospiraceae bacterium]
MKKKVALWGFGILIIVFLIPSCVSNKKYQDMVKQHASAVERFNILNRSCEEQSKTLSATIESKRELVANHLRDLAAKDSLLQADKRLVASLTKEIDFMRGNNTNLLGRLTDLAVINKTGAESIQQSLKAINEQNGYIRDLSKSIQSKDSLNLALVMNLKRALQDINDDDVQIEVKKGVVYISLSDKMLYKSGSADINPQALAVLGKIAKVLDDHKNLDILVEGHTDNVPIATTQFADNWDLSTKRATSVVRVLQWKYHIEPERMTAGGRSEYVPKADNFNATGRQLNRRTEIILLPQLDQFFKLLEKDKSVSTTR